MSSRPRGRAIIMNITNYKEKPRMKKDGAEVDVERLARLFDQLGFTVERWEECTKEVKSM